LRGRISRLEARRGLDVARRLCPDCGGGPVFEHHYPSARERYPFGPPCSTCGGGGGSSIRKIVIHQVGETCEICDKEAPKDHRSAQ
jgi:hypothetical protein